MLAAVIYCGLWAMGYGLWVDVDVDVVWTAGRVWRGAEHRGFAVN